MSLATKPAGHFNILKYNSDSNVIRILFLGPSAFLQQFYKYKNPSLLFLGGGNRGTVDWKTHGVHRSRWYATDPLVVEEARVIVSW